MTDSTLTRRDWIASLARLVAGGTALATLAALRPDTAEARLAAPRRIVVYKDPDCGCCKAWVTHLGRNGYAPEPHDRRDMDALKDSLGVPAALRSCHTAVVGRYVIEGHVPAADITRLLAKPARGIVGLAVPGMPAGSPGMEMPGGGSSRYDVMAFTAAGQATVFASHG
jgi:hypothetical protein